MSTVKANVKRFGDKKEPACVECPVIKENAKTVLVQLPDGNRINRHKSKHVVMFDSKTSGLPSFCEIAPILEKSPETT